MPKGDTVVLFKAGQEFGIPAVSYTKVDEDERFLVVQVTFEKPKPQPPEFEGQVTVDEAIDLMADFVDTPSVHDDPLDDEDLEEALDAEMPDLP